MTRTRSGRYEDPGKYNVHAATSRDQCLKMGKLNRGTFVEAEPNGTSTLKVDCIFEGGQTTFTPDKEE